MCNTVVPIMGLTGSMDRLKHRSKKMYVRSRFNVLSSSEIHYSLQVSEISCIVNNIYLLTAVSFNLTVVSNN